MTGVTGDGPPAPGGGRHALVRARGAGGERLRPLPGPPAPPPPGRGGAVAARVRVPPHGRDGGPARPALLLGPSRGQATQVVSQGRHHHSLRRLVRVPSLSGL